MTRHEIREEIMKIIFQLNFYDKDSIKEQIDSYFDSGEIFNDEDNEKTFSEIDKEEIEEKVLDIIKNQDKIDSLIDKVAEGWKVSRMAKVDLSILRISFYEIEIEKLPVGVVINEAVELAKDFGSDNSPSFVNGVLARFVKNDEK